MLFCGSWILTLDGKAEYNYKMSLPLYSKNEKIWVHLTPKNEEELSYALKNYNIHPLTIEDILNPQGRIKVEKFPNYTFLVFRGLHFDSQRIVAKNFNFIVKKNTLISVVLDHRNTIADLIEDFEETRQLLEKGIEFILHKIFDLETDHMLPIVYRIEDQAADFETQVYKHHRNLDIASVFVMRANLQQIKKVIIQHVELLNTLEASKLISQRGLEVFFRDIRDHSMRILEIAETVRETISSALEVHLTISSQKSNEIMTILTMLTAIMLPMSLIAGLYGMNFKYIPLLEDRMGFFISLGMMGFIGLVMGAYFKLRKWF
ncbi:MAG: magnesium transporter CorA family protein [Leptospiraceae bacterium]|nr:magnesium transporter CorA family protein [Leptospiraceae bacterium]